MVGERATDLAQRCDARDAATARPAISRRQPARVLHDGATRLGTRTLTLGSARRRRGDTSRPGGRRTPRWVPRSRWRGCARCPVAPRTPRWVCRPRPTRWGTGPGPGPIMTRNGRLCANGGMPPMVKPVTSVASFAVARRRLDSLVTADSRAISTRLAPLTRAITASRPASVGATNTRLLTIWPSSAPTAAAASDAVWVESLKVRISTWTPLRAAASRTRCRAG